MNSASLLRFLEDFGHPRGVGPVQALPELVSEEAPMEAEPVDEPTLEERLAMAREEGANSARAELGERHLADLQKQKAELATAAQQMLDASITKLSAATEELFAQYDSWLDRLFETSLRPLVSGVAHAATLDEFKSRLLEAAGKDGVKVKLTGPEALVVRMQEMLQSSGLEIEARPDGQAELRAEIDAQCLQTRFSRVEELLSSGLKTLPEARDD